MPMLKIEKYTYNIAMAKTREVIHTTMAKIEKNTHVAMAKTGEVSHTAMAKIEISIHIAILRSQKHLG